MSNGEHLKKPEDREVWFDGYYTAIKELLDGTLPLDQKRILAMMEYIRKYVRHWTD